ncbi:MAG: hypothetical protein J6I50_03875 [Clostridia bacterium]|nr:hypothetical protein [Clostridia bacterium]
MNKSYKKYVNGAEMALTEEEITEIERRQAEFEAKEKRRPFMQEEVILKMIRSNINDLHVDDAEAYRMKAFYPAWETLSETSYCADIAGYKFTYQGDLYKTVSANHTFAAYWVPGEGTESLYTRIDETHDGTEFDPIPYHGNMELMKGTYYIQDDTVYLCTRNTEHAVYQNLADFVSVYVEVAP